MGIQSTDLKCIGTKKTDTFLGFPFNIALRYTNSKILEEITLFVALGVEGNLKCVHFYDNQFGSRDPIKRDTDVQRRLHTGVSQEFKDLCQLFRENQITLDVLFTQ
jgi:thymidylate synthase